VPVRVAAIGDSLTLYDDEPEDGRLNNSWFAALLRSDPAFVYVYNAGLVGDSTGQMRARLANDVLARDPELVLVLGGINDVANVVPTDEIVANLRAIVVDVQAAGARAVIGTVPPWDELFEPDAVADPDEVLELNAGIRDLATELGVTLVDFYAATAGPDGHWLPGTTRDGLHPDADGVALMADAAITALRP
jgi:lysophospholipase L1-like esterase